MDISTAMKFRRANAPYRPMQKMTAATMSMDSSVKVLTPSPARQGQPADGGRQQQQRHRLKGQHEIANQQVGQAAVGYACHFGSR